MELVVKITRRDDRSVASCDSDNKNTYHFIVHTDRPGGLLTFGEEIANEAEVTLQCPDTFGRM
jgi:hypothetical protein